MAAPRTLQPLRLCCVRWAAPHSRVHPLFLSHQEPPPYVEVDDAVVQELAVVQAGQVQGRDLHGARAAIARVEAPQAL